MSLFSKLAKTLKDTTGIDAGSLTDKVASAASFATLSNKAKGLSQLRWTWSEDAMSTDKGTGKPLRNWDRQTKLTPRLDDIFLNWEKQATDFDEYLIFIGWSGWAYGMIEKDHPEGYFLPEYVEALADNKLNTVKYLTVKAADVPVNCVKFPASATENEFYYVKVVGRTADDKYYDVKGCTLASPYKREKEGLAGVPEGQIPELKVPAGGREKNDLERELAAKAKEKKK